MAIIINGATGIDMGNTSVSNASQVDSVIINENGLNVATNNNLVGLKNLIINGRKQVNQSGLTVTDNSYNYDNHYKVGNNWFVFIDGKNIVSGEPYTVSWSGIATAGYYIGTAGATTINAQTFTPIANGEAITPSITSSQILWIKFASDATGSTYNKVQFEPGTTPTPYEQRIKELEEFLVQSCLEKVSMISIMFPWSSGTQLVEGSQSFKAKKRTTPIVVLTKLAGASTISITPNTDSFYINGIGNIQTTASYSAIFDARPY